jgi:hypothetical protein
MSDELYVIRKNGCFYRDNAQGYTTNIDRAWRVPLEVARQHENPHDQPVTIHKLSEFAALPPAGEVVELVERLREWGTGDDGWVCIDEAAAEACEQAADALASLSARLAEAERNEKNLQAALTARAKTMLKARDNLINARDGLDDEGDRVYFGSTMDAAEFREVVDELDSWVWGDIIRDGALHDVYEACRKAHFDLSAATGRASSAENRLAEAEQERDEALKEHTDMMWQRRRANEALEDATARAERAERERDDAKTEVRRIHREKCELFDYRVSTTARLAEAEADAAFVGALQTANTNLAVALETATARLERAETTLREAQTSAKEAIKWYDIVPDINNINAVVKALRKIAALDSPAPQGDGWLPIESAPKDAAPGEVVQVSIPWPESRAKHLIECWHPKAIWDRLAEDDSKLPRHLQFNKPSHWRPHTPPPATPNKGARDE